MKRIAAVCMISLFLPYLFTLAWTSRADGMTRLKSEAEEMSERKIILDRNGQEVSVPLEEYLIGVCAMQIPADYEPETIKAQMVIARTYLYGLMGEEKEIPESALDLDVLTENDMENKWGKEDFLSCYSKFSEAAKATRGQILTFEGKPAEPLFHAVSAGRTREGGSLHPCLASVDSPGDVEAPGYISVTAFTLEEFCSRLNEMENSPGISPEGAFESLQIVERDEAGYVVQVQVGEKLYTGEEVQYALGLKSCAFSFEKLEGTIRCTTEGDGHGYGFDQWGANEKAKEGYTAEELLKIYYKNIVLISE